MPSIIGLDLYTGGEHKVNQKWLDRKLSEKRPIHLFLFAHEPPLKQVIRIIFHFILKSGTGSGTA